jgi:hypothetical protein
MYSRQTNDTSDELLRHVLKADGAEGSIILISNNESAIIQHDTADPKIYSSGVSLP